jgi:alpha,alpha-trehalase
MVSSPLVPRGLRALALAAAAFGLGAAAPPSPAELYGPLFAAVQEARIFPDGKTFADAVALRPAAAIRAAFAAERPRDADALRGFVRRHFILPDAPLPAADDLAAHIRSLWPTLTRPPLAPPPGSSALPLPHPFVVPGGRFREIYYWDSYFTMLGLRLDGRADLVEGLIDNFVSLVARHGRVPNGTRTYYLSRSQPPFLALMVDLSDSDSPGRAKARLAALRAEHAFWMAGRDCAGAGRPCLRVVRMPDGALLNRYFDDKDTPRDESWAEDVATAAASGRPPAEVWRDLRAAAESGWDFSSRWLADPQRLATIRTTQIVPVDLNSLLWRLETAIGARCRAAGDDACAQAFAAAAEARARAIQRWLWRPRAARFVDWDLAAGAPSERLSAATLYPLFVGLAAPEQAEAVAATSRHGCWRPAACAPARSAAASNGTRRTAGRRSNGSASKGCADTAMRRWRAPSRRAGWRRSRRRGGRPDGCSKNMTWRNGAPAAAANIRPRTALAGPTASPGPCWRATARARQSPRFRLCPCASSRLSPAMASNSRTTTAPRNSMVLPPQRP